MSSRRLYPKLLVLGIQESISNIFEYTEGVDLENIESNKMCRDAVIRNLEIIGEAADHLPESVYKAFPEIPWRQVIGLRNRLIHDYMGIDFVLLAEILSVHLPFFQESLLRVLPFCEALENRS